MSTILELDVLNFVAKHAPQLAVLNSLNLVYLSSRHSQLELDLYVLPLLGSLRNLKDHEIVYTFYKLQNVFPMRGEFVRLDLIKDLG